MVEDLNGLFGVNVIMASDFVLELLERSLVQWTDVDSVARNPDVLLEVYALVCVCHLKGMIICWYSRYLICFGEWYG